MNSVLQSTLHSIRVSYFNICIAECRFWMSRDRVNLRSQFIRQPQIVCVQESNPFTAGFCYSSIARCRRTRVHLTDAPQIASRQLVQDEFRVIDRSIVHHDDFQIGPALRTHTTNCIRQRDGVVICWNYDADAGSQSNFYRLAKAEQATPISATPLYLWRKTNRSLHRTIQTDLCEMSTTPADDTTLDLFP